MSPATERLLVQRYVDGELAGATLGEFERRLLRESRLRESVAELRAVRRALAAAASAPASAPAGFSARVLDEVCRLPRRDDRRRQADAVDGEIAAMRVMAHRVMVAAVLLCGLALLVWAGLLRRADSGRVDAADRKALLDLQQRIEQEREAERPRGELRRR